MLPAACLPQVRAEACISVQASWEQVNSSNCPNHVWQTKSSFKKQIIVHWTDQRMFGEQTFAQLRMGLRFHVFPPFSVILQVLQKEKQNWTTSLMCAILADTSMLAAAHEDSHWTVCTTSSESQRQPVVPPTSSGGGGGGILFISAYWQARYQA